MGNVLSSMALDRKREAGARARAAWALVNKTIGAQAMLLAVLQDLRDRNEAPTLRMKLAERQGEMAREREVQTAAYHRAEGALAEAEAWCAILRDTKPVAPDTNPVAPDTNPVARDTRPVMCDQPAAGVMAYRMDYSEARDGD